MVRKGVFNIFVLLIISFNKGDFNPAKFVEGDVTESLAKITIIIAIAIIQIAFKVIVGLPGSLQAFGKGTGGFHIFLGISLIMSIDSLISLFSFLENKIFNAFTPKRTLYLTWII